MSLFWIGHVPVLETDRPDCPKEVVVLPCLIGTKIEQTTREEMGYVQARVLVCDSREIRDTSLSWTTGIGLCFVRPLSPQVGLCATVDAGQFSLDMQGCLDPTHKTVCTQKSFGEGELLAEIWSQMFDGRSFDSIMRYIAEQTPHRPIPDSLGDVACNLVREALKGKEEGHPADRDWGFAPGRIPKGLAVCGARKKGVFDDSTDDESVPGQSYYPLGIYCPICGTGTGS